MDQWVTATSKLLFFESPLQVITNQKSKEAENNTKLLGGEV